MTDTCMPSPSGCDGGQLADARRHADGVGDGVRVDVGIARVRRVGHRRAPRLPSQLAGRDHQRCRQRAANRAGRGRVNERREPDAGQHDRADVERQQVPGGLVPEGREDPRGDGDVAGEIARPEGGFGAQTLRRCSGQGPRRQRTDNRQHEDQSLAPSQAPRRTSTRAVRRSSATGARGPQGRCRDRDTCRLRGTARGRRRGWRETPE